jgi:cytochrome c-550 PedF
VKRNDNASQISTKEFEMRKLILMFTAAIALPVFSVIALSHGDVQPQPVDTTGLNPVGVDWLKENPYRKDKAQFELGMKIGSSGYNQNCARCHGLEVKSGGMAPDLRFLEEGKFGDEWFIERIRGGYTQNGLTKMPKFEGILSQEAMWAIRSYIETRPQD